MHLREGRRYGRLIVDVFEAASRRHGGACRCAAVMIFGAAIFYQSYL